LNSTSLQLTAEIHPGGRPGLAADQKFIESFTKLFWIFSATKESVRKRKRNLAPMPKRNL